MIIRCIKRKVEICDIEVWEREREWERHCFQDDVMIKVFCCGVKVYAWGVETIKRQSDYYAYCF